MAVGVAALRTVYNKLVRDKVPSAIEADGHSYEIDVLSPDDYILELKRKLVEEAQEALASSTRDQLVVELADLLEVMMSLATSSAVSMADLDVVRTRRRAERGGFEHRLLLRHVDHAELPASG
jgi:predicted house-cleaning noncanonical NTP pyrophosphatase (MazG superfamily)